MTRRQIVILGAGPAGLGAALQLARSGAAQVTLLEQADRVGGIAASFEVDSLPVDYGSHRLHVACDPVILQDIREMLGEDLLDRPRHGRIRLSGRWVHFPLKPLDLALKLPPHFALGVGLDVVRRLTSRQQSGGQDTFASVLERGLGRTICRDFYFPYAHKLWGLDPEQLSATQAHRRMATKSLGHMIRKALGVSPGIVPAGRPGRSAKGRFYYPRRGFGQISEAYARAATQAGAGIHLNATVRSVEAMGSGGHLVGYEQNGRLLNMPAEQVWSTIPVTALSRMLQPLPSHRAQVAPMRQVAERIRYRAMVLVYLVLDQDRFSPFDAHYFPSLDIPISRLSEPKNYRGEEPSPPNEVRRTVLCAELPCDTQGTEWTMSDEALGEMVCASLEAAGIGVRGPVRQVLTRRLEQAYPIYRQGYEADLEQLEQYVDSMEGIVSFGRQGLFAHDNIHHALHVGYSVADCLDGEGDFDRERWRAYRHDFESHVVED